MGLDKALAWELKVTGGADYTFLITRLAPL